MTPLTHLDDSGAARMVDVGGKAETAREATATGRIAMSSASALRIRRTQIGANVQFSRIVRCGNRLKC